MAQPALRGVEKKSAARAAHRERARRGHAARAEKRSSESKSVVQVLVFVVVLAAVNVGIRALVETKGASAEFMELCLSAGRVTEQGNCRGGCGNARGEMVVLQQPGMPEFTAGHGLETYARMRRMSCCGLVCPSSPRNWRGWRLALEAARAVSRKRFGRSVGLAPQSTSPVHRKPRRRLAGRRRASQDSGRKRQSVCKKWTSGRAGSKTKP